MTIKITVDGNTITLSADGGTISGRHQSQFEYWGFAPLPGNGIYRRTSDDPCMLVSKVVGYLERCGIPFELDEQAQVHVEASREPMRLLRVSAEIGQRIKNGDIDRQAMLSFVRFVECHVHRPLKEHQLKAAFHLFSVKHGANFSVPGSGKTTVVLVVFEQLRLSGVVDSLFVVGPPSCFGPWRTEYHKVLGRTPSVEVLLGGDASDRRNKYYVDGNRIADLYLSSFQTFHRDWQHVRSLMNAEGGRFYLVVDEAHYMKQIDGSWASAILEIANHAKFRCALTGTPFPRAISDGFNLFDFLWPRISPISQKDRIRVEASMKNGDILNAQQILAASVGPFFYRVRKTELGLAAQNLHPPIQVPLKRYEKEIYSAITARVRDLAADDYIRDFETLNTLRRARMIRVRQCVSYPRLLISAISGYNDEFLEGDASLADTIGHYDEIERPGKLDALIGLLARIGAHDKKVVVWSNFVGTLHNLRRAIEMEGYEVRLIYGGTPIHLAPFSEEMTREQIIDEFNDPAGTVNVLVANPAACSEAVSLHKLCSNAIYYDVSYNCAHYLQSMDRIHRVGASENRGSDYYFLQYANTMEDDILQNVRRKSHVMSSIIDQDYPVYSLDMFEQDDEELAAYRRLFL